VTANWRAVPNGRPSWCTNEHGVIPGEDDHLHIGAPLYLTETVATILCVRIDADTGQSTGRISTSTPKSGPWTTLEASDAHSSPSPTLERRPRVHIRTSDTTGPPTPHSANKFGAVKSRRLRLNG
jgi:hypothetical protein